MSCELLDIYYNDLLVQLLLIDIDLHTIIFQMINVLKQIMILPI